MTIPANLHRNDTDSEDYTYLTNSLNSIFSSGRTAGFLQGIETIGLVEITRNGVGTWNYGLFFPAGSTYNPSGTTADKTDGMTGYVDGTKYINIGNDDVGMVDGVSADFTSSAGSTMFHELFHALSLQNAPAPVSGYDYQYAEQIAVFATNAVYSLERGEGERFGHYSGGSNGGATSQLGYIDVSDAISFNWKNGSAVFSTVDANGTFNRTYWKGVKLDGHDIFNYVTVERNVTSGSVYGMNLDAKMTALIGQSYVAGGTSGVMTAYSIAKESADIAKLISSDFADASYTQQRTVMVSNERFSDGPRPGSSSISPSPAIDAIGPLDTMTGQAPAKFFIFDDGASADTLLMGGHGGRPDLIKSGTGNDVISLGGGAGSQAWGGGGDDILIGSGSSNSLYGEDGNDILVARGSGEVLDGGGNDDMAYFGLLSSGIVLDLSGAIHGQSANIAATHLESIEYVYGTIYKDRFVGNGSTTFYGGGGGDTFVLHGGDKAYGSAMNDTFIISTGAPTVVGNGGHDTVKFEGTQVRNFGVSGSDISVDGTVYSGISEFHTGDGDNTITAFVQGRSIHGGQGNDTFAPTYLNSWNSFDGGGGVNTLDLSGLVNKTTVYLDMKEGTLEAYGDTYDVSSITNFDFTGLGFELRMTDAGEIINSFDNPSQWWGKIYARGGGDIVFAKDYDYVYGDGGDDIIFMSNIGEAHGGADNDTIYTTGQATLYGDGGNDILHGSSMSNALYGGSGNDELYGYGGMDQLYGGSGNNLINGGGEWDFAFIESAGRGYINGVKAIFQNGDSSWSVIKAETNIDGTHQVDTLIGIETIMLQNNFGQYTESINLYDGYSYFSPDFMV